MLNIIAKQYKFLEEIELLIYEYLRGSVNDYKKQRILNINKNIINYSIIQYIKLEYYINYTLIR